MYLTWLVARGLHDPAFFAALPDGDRYVTDIIRRKRTAMSMRRVLDGSLPSEILSDQARAFTDGYYAERHATYLDDWVAEFGAAGDRYEIPDSWETFDRIAHRIDARFQSWTRKANQRRQETDVESPSGSAAPSPPPDASPLEAAARAITAAGGRVVPSPVDRLRSRHVAGPSTDRLAELAAQLMSGSTKARRASIAELASAPLSDETAAVLREAARSSDPVVTAIAIDVLVINQSDESGGREG
jgi:hypothetical protein